MSIEHFTIENRHVDFDLLLINKLLELLEITEWFECVIRREINHFEVTLLGDE